MANGGLEVVNRSEPEQNRLSDSENAAPVGTRPHSFMTRNHRTLTPMTSEFPGNTRPTSSALWLLTIGLLFALG